VFGLSPRKFGIREVIADSGGRSAAAPENAPAQSLRLEHGRDAAGRRAIVESAEALAARDASAPETQEVESLRRWFDNQGASL